MPPGKWHISFWPRIQGGIMEGASAERAERAARSAKCPAALSVALFAALATGCTPWGQYKANGCKVGPNYCKPSAAIADQWIDAADKRLSSEEPDLSHWWTALGDPKLDELIQSAYRQNLSLREAGFRILQARSQLAIQMGNLFPQTQQAFGSYQRAAISTLAANQELLPNRFFSNWDLGFNLSWELDFWGRFRRAIDSAADALDASVFDYDDVLVTLLGDVASTYVEIRTLQQEIAYVRDNIKIQNESLGIAKARFAGGLTSELDAEQAESQLAQTEALIPQFEKRLRQANDRLCVLLGIPTEDLVKKLGDEAIPTTSPDIVVGIPADLLTRRPDIRRAERIAAAQCEQIGIAEAELYPAIAITGTVGFDAARFTNLFKDHSFQSSIGPGFQWNVLNYGRLVNNVRLQWAKFYELVTAYRQTVLQANSEAEDGIVEFLQSQLQAQALQRSVGASSRAVDLAVVQYKNGLVDFNRVALLEQNLVQQQDLLAQAQGDIALGLVHTYRALGGGWEIRCTGQGDRGEVGVAPPGPKNVEELPPGKPAPGSKTPSQPRQSRPSQRGLPLPGPADELQPNPSSEIPPPTPQAKSQHGPTLRAANATVPVDTANSTSELSDKPLRLRYSNDARAMISHAGLLPGDRGETRFLR
jgi:NodT family efflux transporter outer membrane factor (OMF) lipoprotein